MSVENCPVCQSIKEWELSECPIHPSIKTIIPQTGTAFNSCNNLDCQHLPKECYFRSEISKWKLDCARLKALLADVYKFAMTYDKNWKIKHAELQARIKQEEIE